MCGDVSGHTSDGGGVADITWVGAELLNVLQRLELSCPQRIFPRPTDIQTLPLTSCT